MATPPKIPYIPNQGVYQYDILHPDPIPVVKIKSTVGANGSILELKDVPTPYYTPDCVYAANGRVVQKDHRRYYFCDATNPNSDPKNVMPQYNWWNENPTARTYGGPPCILEPIKVLPLSEIAELSDLNEIPPFLKPYSAVTAGDKEGIKTFNSKRVEFQKALESGDPKIDLEKDLHKSSRLRHAMYYFKDTCDPQTKTPLKKLQLFSDAPDNKRFDAAELFRCLVYSAAPGGVAELFKRGLTNCAIETPYYVRALMSREDQELPNKGLPKNWKPRVDRVCVVCLYDDLKSQSKKKRSDWKVGDEVELMVAVFPVCQYQGLMEGWMDADRRTFLHHRLQDMFVNAIPVRSLTDMSDFKVFTEYSDVTKLNGKPRIYSVGLGKFLPPPSSVTVTVTAAAAADSVADATTVATTSSVASTAVKAAVAEVPRSPMKPLKLPLSSSSSASVAVVVPPKSPAIRPVLLSAPSATVAAVTRSPATKKRPNAVLLSSSTSKDPHGETSNSSTTAHVDKKHKLADKEEKLQPQPISALAESKMKEATTFSSSHPAPVTTNGVHVPSTPPTPPIDEAAMELRITEKVQAELFSLFSNQFMTNAERERQLFTNIAGAFHAWAVASTSIAKLSEDLYELKKSKPVSATTTTSSSSATSTSTSTSSSSTTRKAK